MRKYVVNENQELFSFLKRQEIPDKKVKQFLKNREVCVNDTIVTQYNFKLKANDVVSIFERIDGEIPVLYEDKDLIIVVKPFRMLTVADHKEHEETLYHKVSNYIKKKNKKARLFIVHRLDYETAGLVLFAKSEKIKKELQDHWNSVIRKYLTVVHGRLEGSGTLRFFLKEGKNYFVIVTNKSRDAKEAITKYQSLKVNDNYSLLSLQIETGRKHQIRVSLKEIGHPIVGDTKYGAKEKASNLYLFANVLIFKHPVLKSEIEIIIPNLETFLKLV